MIRVTIEEIDKFGMIEPKLLGKAIIHNTGDHRHHPKYGNYQIFFDGIDSFQETHVIKGYLRENGIWPLLKKVFNKIKTPKKEKKVSDTAPIRIAYQTSYEKRYGINPVWGARENSLALSLIKSIGLTEAVYISGKYPQYPEPFHIRASHPFKLLVSQIDQVRVALKNPNRMLDAGIAKMELGKASKRMSQELEDEAFFRAKEAEKLEGSEVKYIEVKDV